MMQMGNLDCLIQLEEHFTTGVQVTSRADLLRLSKAELWSSGCANWRLIWTISRRRRGQKNCPFLYRKLYFSDPKGQY